MLLAALDRTRVASGDAVLEVGHSLLQLIASQILFQLNATPSVQIGANADVLIFGEGIGLPSPNLRETRGAQDARRPAEQVEEMSRGASIRIRCRRRTKRVLRSRQQ